LDSQIISDIPEIFAEFWKKRFSLLWRGSRDGFKVKELHDQCDGHTNTLTVILDTKGNIFGGLTRLKWESWVWNGKNLDEDNRLMADDSLKSFIFTLKNPHNISARRFALKSEIKHQAIFCWDKRGPCFGSFPSEIAVSDDCNTTTRCCTSLALTYTNATGLKTDIAFRSSDHFQVKEIEVFEITE
jgi:hypothetical protein